MEGYTAWTYGEGFADVYDAWYADSLDTEPAVERMATLSGSRPLLELGVGTGRLAHPLSERGVKVVGIDASRSMLDRLSSRTTTRAVATVQADMAALPFAARSFATVLAAYNVLFNLPDLDAQRACIADVRRVLVDGGAFVVEAFALDDVHEVRSGIDVREVLLDRVVLTASKLDPEAQTIAGQHIEISEAGIRMRPWFLHYLRTDQLDDLAAEVGLTLESRWDAWDGTPFSDESARHVSVYRVA